MKKITSFFLMACGIQGAVNAQTLFSYGPYKVDKQEFLWAYRKNNTQAAGKSVDAYLNLYIDYKLKVRAAEDARLDSAADFQRDQRGFTRELSDQTMHRLEGIGRLSQEALERGQTDVEIAQIFIGFTRPGDSTEAYTRIREARDQLAKGVPFATVASTYGSSPLLKTTGGYTGYITAFSLPYAAENIVYGLKDGAWSGIYRSRSGYHIFKRLGQRPNPGSIRVAQILIALPPKATQADKDKALSIANHVYDSLKKGGNFDSLVRRYSDDKMTYYNYGLLPDFTTGDFDPAFEKAAFALAQNGDVSAPIETAYGYHIIKKIGLQPALRDSLDNQRWYTLQQKVFYSDRMDAAKAAFAESSLPMIRYRDLRPDTAWLFRTTDTLLKTRGGEEYIKKVRQIPLFSFENKTYTSTDWFRYLLYKRTGDGKDPFVRYPDILRTFLHTSALEYVQANLDHLYPEYHYQVREFADGTLLFSITQQDVWNRAEDDTAALRSWFWQHKDQFHLRPSADALFFSAADSSSLSRFRAQLLQAPSRWRETLGAYPSIAADSARVELQALSIDSAGAQAGLVTTPALQPDNHYHVYALLKVYPPVPATGFEEVKGLVLNDYQNYLERKWIAGLRRKYPVTVNQSVLAQIKR
ncbi:peptidylprolyl isomerase [Dinghuibacter silviterrae]|uniref:peptidylprolyl isomerase n=1 Tax=Dinghuibacter silviterrae TaxID=1539049 RepID=A0A4R8DNG8_9BACT|nr:peptidylprolyl isomerase [Dinghuibacter silviterrae]TDW99553.1 peptidyl-prolyl cis-trans isomerase SurA [Dinghuibacter silviterrae]